MKLNKEVFDLDPELVSVEERQRKRLNKESLAELKASIALYGVLNPIVVRKTEKGATLVFGAHRLEACKQLQITVPSFFFEDLTLLEAKVIELEENIKRSDLEWEDKVKAIAEIHFLHKEEDSTWNNSKTAKELSLSNTFVSQVLAIFPHLGTKRLEAATGISHAYNILGRIAERKAGEIVNVLLGSAITTNQQNNPPPPVSEAPQTVSKQNAEKSVELKYSNIKNEEVSMLSSSDIFEIPTENKVIEVQQIKEKLKEQEKEKITVEEQLPILETSFLEWAPKYKGEKFSLIHVDFPYGVFHSANKEGNFGTTFDGTSNSQEDLYENDKEIYNKLLSSFIENFTKFASHSCHVIFWFSMNFYAETKSELEKADLRVQAHPFIWHKSDSKGVSPWPHGPKRIYDTAFICSKGARTMVKQGTNAFSGPTPSNKIHPSEKSEPMLKYFLSSYIDESTTVLDICSGSGVAIRAAEDLKAKSCVGIELNPTYAAAGNSSILRARNIRRLKLT